MWSFDLFGFSRTMSINRWLEKVGYGRLICTEVRTFEVTYLESIPVPFWIWGKYCDKCLHGKYQIIQSRQEHEGSVNVTL